MKVTIFVCFVAFAAVITQAKPGGRMPEDMPADLEAKAKAVHAEIRAWKQENPGKTWRDVPEELRQKMKDIRTEYKTATGNEWPKRGGGRRGGGGNDTSSAE